MSWKKHFRIAAPITQLPAGGAGGGDQAGTGTSSKYSSYLPEVYSGHPNRIARYYQYDDMDKDSDIRSALDTIADFCTQSEEQNDNPFKITFSDDATEVEVRLVNAALTKWCKLNEFRSRLWYMFRETIKNGDQFFLRDPETGEWLWIDHFMVELVKVDEDNGKTPDEYIIRGLDYNKQAKFATRAADPNQYRNPFGAANAGGARPMAAPAGGPAAFSLSGANVDPRARHIMGALADQLFVVDAQNVIHLSMSVGQDINWPFGQSILEPVFKTYKQKSLLEDAIIIYRVSRAPERRIFYIDTGSMPQNRARAHLEQIKNEIHQRRIPNRTGGGSSILDAAYNPLGMMEDFFFAQGENRGSRVETLPGGELVGEIGDLVWFSRKLARGLRIPLSYLSLGQDDGNSAVFNDGKVGSALIQENLFNKYCLRMQSLLAPRFDKEFKRYIMRNGIEIDESIYDLRFNPPVSFGKYRQIEVDSAQMQVYGQIAENRRLSERFKLRRFLNLTEDEILESEQMWAEENADKIKRKTGGTPAENTSDQGLSAVGIRGGDPLGGDAFDGADMGEAPGDAGAGGAPGDVGTGGAPGDAGASGAMPTGAMAGGAAAAAPPPA